MATNQVSFYYRKDLNVTKHGEYKANVLMDFGTAVKLNETTKKAEVAATSAEFRGVVDKIIYNVQGNDDLTVKADERCRVGIGKDYEIVLMASKLGGTTKTVGTKVGVLNGKFQALDATVTVAVGEIVDVFANGETVIRIY